MLFWSRRKAVAFATVLLLSTGCGTIYNMRPAYTSNDPYTRKVMGGVREDAQGLFSQDRGEGGLLALVDLPLSVIGDIVTLPWTLFAATNRPK